jgi:hypothetical protein
VIVRTVNMDDRCRVLAAAAALILLLGGCSPAGRRDVLAVGTCVVSDGDGTTPVACGEAHTHKVIAIAARPEGCPSETDMFAQPADPDDGTTTECFRRDATAK